MAGKCNSRAIMLVKRRTSVIAVLVLLVMLNYKSYKETPVNKNSLLSHQVESISFRFLSRSDWLKEDIPKFCDLISADPKPCVFRGAEGVRCSNKAEGKVMFSLNQQDYYLYTRHFKYLSRQGTYLDIAANDPIAYSNTFFFDRCLRWSGICLEANDKYFEPIFRERSCVLIPTCASERDGLTVEFNLEGIIGGILDKNYKFMSRVKRGINITRTKSMRCMTVQNIQHRLSLSHVDYMSLDVEGNELSVLKGINWDQIQVNILTVEIGPKMHLIELFLLQKGFRRHYPEPTADELKIHSAFLKTEAIFIHRTVEFGKPL